jgi:hypothetical protein
MRPRGSAAANRKLPGKRKEKSKITPNSYKNLNESSKAIQYIYIYISYKFLQAPRISTKT